LSTYYFTVFDSCSRKLIFFLTFILLSYSVFFRLLEKKQRLGTSKTNTPNQKYISNIRDSNNNTNSNNSLANAHHQQQQQQQQDTEIMFSHITEMTFFELVKKALRTPEVYKNFLRCIALFNQEIVTRTDLIKLVEPYLGKFPELYRWFKNYVEDKEQNNFASDNPSGYNNKHPYKDRIDLPTGDNVQLEIDYSSCKQYGASYREISAYPQALCSGRTQLCKQVLNDTFVSFPCWSEDSTFVTSKKNQYEELIFRTEDERFEVISV
jgi:histone deacetylase complex regulatory component SIN3